MWVNDTMLDGRDDSNDNLVAHIRVGPSYHQREEVWTLFLFWHIHSSRAIAPTLGSQTLAGLLSTYFLIAVVYTFYLYGKLELQFS